MTQMRARSEVGPVRDRPAAALATQVPTRCGSPKVLRSSRPVGEYRSHDRSGPVIGPVKRSSRRPPHVTTAAMTSRQRVFDHWRRPLTSMTLSTRHPPASLPQDWGHSTRSVRNCSKSVTSWFANRGARA